MAQILLRRFESAGRKFFALQGIWQRLRILKLSRLFIFSLQFISISQAAVQLYYSQGLTEQVVGEHLGIDRRTVHGRLKRAKGRLLQHHRDLRREQFDLYRNMTDQDED